VAIALTAAPYASYAKDGNKGHEAKGEARVEAKAEANAGRNSGSWFSRVFSKVFGNRAKAATTSKVSASASVMPSISGISAPTVLKVGETGTWSVKAKDPQNGSLSYAVDWGEISTTAAARAETAFVQTSTFSHAYANPGTYTVKFTVTNEAGLSATSTVTVHVTGKATPAAPVVSDVTAVSNRPHQATISWKTDVAASSAVWYGTTTPVSTSGKAAISRPGLVRDHKIVLTGLKADTTYYVVVGSKNAGGMNTSSEISFTTPAAPDRVTPVITSLTAPKEVEAGMEAKVSVNAYDPKNDSLSYSVDWGDESDMTTALRAHDPIFVQSSTFTHVYSEPGTYKATFTAENSAGEKTSRSTRIVVTEDES
jgi:PKD repeat protein